MQKTFFMRDRLLRQLTKKSSTQPGQAPSATSGDRLWGGGRTAEHTGRKAAVGTLLLLLWCLQTPVWRSHRATERGSGAESRSSVTVLLQVKASPGHSAGFRQAGAPLCRHGSGPQRQNPSRYFAASLELRPWNARTMPRKQRLRQLLAAFAVPVNVNLPLASGG